jgi:uncharacterized SAM-binding protein YcdF (DUF218 family)
MNAQVRNTTAQSAARMSEPVGWGMPAPLGHGKAGFRILAGLGLFVSAIVLALGLGFLQFVSSLERVERRPDIHADGIVALTGGAQRIGDAIDLLAQGYARRLLISGVNERTSRDAIARLNPGQRRLLECCVDLDYRARNTIGNAIETRRWAEQNRFRSLIVVTSAYHMPRTLAELDHALPGLKKVPYPVVTPHLDPDAWWRSFTTARVLVSEYLKLLLVQVRMLIEADPESSSVATFFGGEPVKVVAEPLTH